MLKGSGRSFLRTASLATLVAASAVIAGCGNTADTAATPKAAKTPEASVAERRLLALFTTLPPSTDPVQAAMVTYMEAETTPTIDPDDPEDGEPLPATPGSEVPGADQKPCTDDAQFQVEDGTANPYALVNRHVLCVKKQLTDSFYVNDKDGYHAGNLTIDTRWSVHGVHNKLEKQGQLSLRYSYAKTSGTVVPKLNVVAKISCTSQSGMTVDCNVVTPTITLTSGAANSQNLVIPITWNKSLGKIAATTIRVRLFYTTDNSTPVEKEDGSGTTTGVDTDFDQWVLRCDVDTLRAGWKGCVFPDAAAVWTPAQASDTVYARGHIANVFATMPNVVGMFKMQPGQRSQALSFGQNAPLTRTDHANKVANRTDALKRCATTDPEEQARINKYCTADMVCDCDEYPPASAKEGAQGKPYDQFSVRKIKRADNQKAGSQLGAMYSKERVLLNDNFWINVGNVSVPVPPPTFPPTPGTSDVSASFAIVGNEYTESMVAGQNTNLITVKNIGKQTIKGPFQFYFRNLPATITIHNATSVREGVPYITLNYMDFEPGMTQSFEVNYSGAKLVFTHYIFRGEYVD
ncbi:MAG: NucA/NucB deoxyribonuclease domain-containing protein [Telluria sp.]